MKIQKIRRNAPPMGLTLLVKKLSVLLDCTPQTGTGSDIEAIRRSAEHGEAEAQYNLGYLYYQGEGLPQDYTQAANWFTKAAEQGDAGAELNLGYMYYKGQGLPMDDKEAIRWFKKAAEQGTAMAQVNLGYMYYRGQGVRQDFQQAVTWYKKAAEQGEPMAQVKLGFMSYKGQGVPQDYQQSLAWYKKAAEQGESMAQYNLGVMYGKGEGVQQDYNQAVGWLKKAAEQGYTMAQYYLGVAYSKGRGVPQNYVKAYAWSSLAAAGKLTTPDQLAQAQSLAAELQSKINHKMREKSSSLHRLSSSPPSPKLPTPILRNDPRTNGSRSTTARQRSCQQTIPWSLTLLTRVSLSLSSTRDGLRRLASRCAILCRPENELGSS